MSNLTLEQMIQQKNDLERQIKQKMSAERKENIAKIIEQMQQYGITVDDLKKGSRKSRSSKKQYTNPETGAVWSGMGKRPKWINEAVAKGIDIETFAS